MNKYLIRSALLLNTGVGVYGFSRGVRSESKFDESPKLTSYKLFHGLISGLIYIVPPWNVYYMTKLANRIEIERRGLDKNNYKVEYEEFFGRCDDTF